MQHDAIDRLGVRKILTQPELLAQVEADVHLVATIVSLAHLIPSRTKETARMVVRKVLESLEKKLRPQLVAAISGV